MPYQLGLPAALARFGLRVELVPGWETRGSSIFSPRGSVSHWTAGPRGATTRPSLNVVLNGRPGLPGPLCNVYLDRDGIAVVCAAGKANHAGLGGWRGLVGNTMVFGTEAEAADADDWTAAQRAAYPRVNAAYCYLGGFSPDMCCGHSEWAPDRKVDINGWPMSAMRSDVAAVLANPDSEDDDMTGEQAAQLARIENILMRRANGGVQDIHNIVSTSLAELRKLAAAVAAGGNVDVQALGAVVIPAVIAAVGEAKGISAEDVEAAVRRVFADAAS